MLPLLSTQRLRVIVYTLENGVKGSRRKENSINFLCERIYRSERHLKRQQKQSGRRTEEPAKKFLFSHTLQTHVHNYYPPVPPAL